MREQASAWAERQKATTLVTIVERLPRRTISLKDEGESYKALLGLSRPMPRAFLRDGGGSCEQGAGPEAPEGERA